MNLINTWQKYSKPIIYVLIGLAVIYAGFLMYNHYLKPSYQLTQFLPQNYQISFEYKNDRLTFPAIQQKKLLENPLFKNVYDNITYKLNEEINRLPENEQSILKKSRHGLVFWQDNQNYGLIVELSDGTSTKQAEQADFSPWQQHLFKKEILLLASTQNLLAQMTNQKIAAGSPAYLSLTIAPWLTIKLNQSFFSGNYDDSFLNSIQTALSPLKTSSAQSYQLEVDSDPYTLITRLVPDSQGSATTSINLKDYLAYLPQNSQLIVGLTDLNEIPGQLTNNPNFKKLWSELDGKLWLGRQISLSSLLKNAQPPVLLSWSADRWQIITTSQNRDLAEYYLKNYLGQFEPKEKTKVLPDGSRSVELIAAPEKIIWQEADRNGWQAFTYPKNEAYKDLGLAIKDGVMIISNQINQNTAQGLELNCSLTPKPWENQPLQTLFWLDPQYSSLKLAGNIKDFKKILLTGYASGEMAMCLGIK